MLVYFFQPNIDSLGRFSSLPKPLSSSGPRGRSLDQEALSRRQNTLALQAREMDVLSSFQVGSNYCLSHTQTRFNSRTMQKDERYSAVIYAHITRHDLFRSSLVGISA